MSLAQFQSALENIAPKILPALVSKGFVTLNRPGSSTETPEAWTVLNRCMLDPLAKALELDVSGDDVAGASGENQDPGVSEIVQRNVSGFRRLFSSYASERNLMRKDEFMAFVQNFGISVEVPILIVQKVFNQVKDTSNNLTSEGFLQAVQLLANKALPGGDFSASERLATFLYRLNSTSAAAQIANPPSQLFSVELPSEVLGKREKHNFNSSEGLWESLFK
jgi:hypothetical protein